MHCVEQTLCCHLTASPASQRDPERLRPFSLPPTAPRVTRHPGSLVSGRVWLMAGALGCVAYTPV